MIRRMEEEGKERCEMDTVRGGSGSEGKAECLAETDPSEFRRK